MCRLHPAIRSGNGAMLKGGSEARTNEAVMEALKQAQPQSGFCRCADPAHHPAGKPGLAASRWAGGSDHPRGSNELVRFIQDNTHSGVAMPMASAICTWMPLWIWTTGPHCDRQQDPVPQAQRGRNPAGARSWRQVSGPGRPCLPGRRHLCVVMQPARARHRRICQRCRWNTNIST